MEYESNDGLVLSLDEEQKHSSILASSLEHVSIHGLSLNLDQEEPVREDTTMLHSPNFSSLRVTARPSTDTLASLGTMWPATTQPATHGLYNVDASVVHFTFLAHKSPEMLISRRTTVYLERFFPRR